MSDSELVFFLNEIKEKIINGTVTESEKKTITECYIKNLFIDENNKKETEENDLLKFLSTGWYVYKHLALTGKMESF